MAVLIYSYSESYKDSENKIGAGMTRVGQSFTGTGGTLNSVKFYIKKVGSPTVNLIARIYSHGGTYGSSSVGVTALASADAIASSSISTTFSLVEFTFTGVNKITLTNGTYYVIALLLATNDASNYIVVGYDGGESTASGNFMTYSASWSSYSASDICFYIYKDDAVLDTSSMFQFF
jgi:hypothetical protein